MKTFLIIVGTIFAGFALMICSGLFYLMSASEITATAHDKTMVVPANDLVPYFDDFTPNEDCESLEKLQYIDSSEDVNYEYDSPKSDEPYIAVTISHEISSDDAGTIYSVK